MMGNTVQKGLWLDPRAKLFLILMCVLSSMFAPSLTYQFALVLLIAVLGVLCGKWKYAVKGVCFYALVCALTVWIMAAMTGTLRTMFVAFLGLFHKVYACGMLAGIVLFTTKVSEFLSAMNRIHAPKKFVITFASCCAIFQPSRRTAFYQGRHAYAGRIALPGRIPFPSGNDSRVYLCSADDDGLQGSGRAFYRFCYPRDRESQSPDLSCPDKMRDCRLDGDVICGCFLYF